MPEELDVLERKIKQLEIEREALKRERDEVSAERLAELKKEFQELDEKRNSLKGQWTLEKERIRKIRNMKSEIENAKTKAEQFEREGDFGKVAELRYGKINDLKKQIEEETAALAEIQKNKKLLKEEVDAEDVAEVVAKWTGIPVSRMLESERSKLIRMEDELHKRVVGQDAAVKVVSDAIRRSRAGLQDANRPIGSFIFIGTTGVGKTELARSLADFLFDDEKAMIRIDMSEYMEKFSVSRLIGAPPGYVGYEEGGQLTEAVRRRQYAVILLDEIEKAHPDVFNVLLQVLEDGRLTDNQGRTVNFKNTIIIMTSNLGSHLIQEKMKNITEENVSEIMNELNIEMTDLLKKTIRPEFLNRIDDVVLFKPLMKSELKGIIDIQLERVQKMLNEKNIVLEVTDDAKEFLIDRGYDVTYGARPLKRVIQKHVINPLSTEILTNNIKPGDKVRLERPGDGRLEFVKIARVS